MITWRSNFVYGTWNMEAFVRHKALTGQSCRALTGQSYRGELQGTHRAELQGTYRAELQGIV